LVSISILGERSKGPRPRGGGWVIRKTILAALASSKLETAYHRADKAIQQIVDLLAA